MPSFIVTLKDGATQEEIAAAKDKARKEGGEIGHEYKLIPSFQVTFKEDAIHTLESDETIKSVEKDAEVTTQKDEEEKKAEEKKDEAKPE